MTTTAYGRLVLYRNLGDGRFEDVSARLGLADHEAFWTGASWSDYDRDGDADLYVCGYVRYEFRPEYAGRASKQYAQLIPFTLNPSSYKPERNLLFRNNGETSATFKARPSLTSTATAERKSTSPPTQCSGRVRSRAVCCCVEAGEERSSPNHGARIDGPSSPLIRVG